MTETYTVRSGILDNAKWTPQMILGYYKAALHDAGFSTTQLPAVMNVPVAFFVTEEPPFKTLHVIDPDGEIDIQISTDTRYPIKPEEMLIRTGEGAEGGEIFVSTYTWNLTGAPGLLGKLREIIRSKPSYAPSLRYLPGTPLAALWADMPKSQAGYPDKPPLPKVAEPPPPVPETEPSEEEEIPDDEPESEGPPIVPPPPVKPPIQTIDVDAPVTVPVPVAEPTPARPLEPEEQPIPAFPSVPEADEEPEPWPAPVADAPVPPPQVVTVDSPRTVQAPKKNLGGALAFLAISGLAAYFQSKRR